MQYAYIFLRDNVWWIDKWHIKVYF